MSKGPLTLSLFPLPEVVLFPGMNLPLHIFEDRYKKMISDSLEKGDQRFFGRLRIAATGGLVPRNEIKELDEGVRERLAKHGIRSDLLDIT